VNATSQEECFVYQAKVTSGVLAGSSADVMDYMVSQLQGSGDDDDDGSGGGGTAPVTLNSPYRVQFLGIPQSDSSTQAGGEDGRNNLGTPPTSVKESSVERQSSSQGRGDTITVVGGILMAAFCLLFVAICVIIHRRRQEWLRERAAGEGGDDPDAAGGPSKNAYKKNGTVKVAADDANNYYGARDLHSDLYNEDEHLQMDGKGGVLRRTAPGDDDGGVVDREKITIDMGCNFKDQLMGVYYGSSSAAAQQQQQRRLQQQQQLGGLYGNGRATSMDSEADSWAQTDGTIGSIEQNLEPITSEV
jgi:hypothetical protein